MTVDELIAELEEYDGDREVYVSDDGRPMEPSVSERRGLLTI